MKRFLTGVVATATLAAGVAIAAAGGGDAPLGLGDKEGTDRAFERVPFEPDRTPVRAIAESAGKKGKGGKGKKKAKKPEINFLSTGQVPIEPNGAASVIGSCPRKQTAIDGGFATDGGIVADTMAPLSSREYAFSVIDLTGLPGSVVFTLTCSKNNG